MYTQEEFKILVNKALKEYKKEWNVPFPIKNELGEYFEEMAELIKVIAFLGNKEMSTIYFEPWQWQDYYCAYYSNKIARTIIIDGDARIEWYNYDDLANELWDYQRQAQELEEKLPDISPVAYLN